MDEYGVLFSTYGALCNGLWVGSCPLDFFFNSSRPFFFYFILTRYICDFVFVTIPFDRIRLAAAY